MFTVDDFIYFFKIEMNDKQNLSEKTLRTAVSLENVLFLA